MVIIDRLSTGMFCPCSETTAVHTLEPHASWPTSYKAPQLGFDEFGDIQSLF